MDSPQYRSPPPPKKNIPPIHSPSFLPHIRNCFLTSLKRAPRDGYHASNNWGSCHLKPQMTFQATLDPTDPRTPPSTTSDPQCFNAILGNDTRGMSQGEGTVSKMFGFFGIFELSLHYCTFLNPCHYLCPALVPFKNVQFGVDQPAAWAQRQVSVTLHAAWVCRWLEVADLWRCAQGCTQSTTKAQDSVPSCVDIDVLA